MEKSAGADVTGSITVVNIEHDMRERKISELKSAINSEKSSRRIVILLGIILILIASFYLKVVNTYVYSIILSLGLFCVCLPLVNTKITDLEDQLKIEEEKQKQTNIKPTKNNSEYFDSLVSINIKNLEDYYTLVKDSNRKSFNTSLWIAITGIIFIAIGLGIGFFYENLKDVSYIATASGILIEIVTALLFYLYNKTVIQLKEYHSSLLDVQNVLLSFKLIGDISDETTKLELMKEMLEFLVKRK